MTAIDCLDGCTLRSNRDADEVVRESDGSEIRGVWVRPVIRIDPLRIISINLCPGGESTRA